MTRQGTRRLDYSCGEQDKLPAAKEFRLAERDKHMSEQEKPKSFMQELDQWTEANVINPLVYVHAEDDDEDWKSCVEQIKKAIRAKVLESYRNGLKAGAKPAPQVAPRTAVRQRR